MTSSRRIVDLRKGAHHAPERVAHPVREPESHKRLPLRVRRRRRRLAVAGGVLAVLLLLGGAAHWVSYMQQFAIARVEVLGTTMLQPDALKQEVNSVLDARPRALLSARNVFLYPRSAIEASLSSDFPRIRSVTISRASLFATSITVRIVERTGQALWCTNEPRCYDFDEHGYVFAQNVAGVEAAPQTPYVFYGGLDESKDPVGQHFVQDHFEGLMTLMKALADAGFAPQTVRIDGNDMHITLKDFTLKASFGQDVSMLVKNLQLVLTSEPLKEKKNRLEYIDLRFDNKVYYKLRGETEVGG